MAPEDLDTLGFDPAVVVKPGPEKPAEEPKEVIAGLSAASKKKGFIFGLGSGSAGR
jgi:hypothetical protein